jgi:hypothetical protein
MKRRLFLAWWVVIAAAPAILIAGFLGFGWHPRLDDFIRLGLLQPAIAAFFALALVLSVRVMLGRFVNDRRKGVNSASSAAIAVRLWAICFVLLVGAMLLSSLVARLPDGLLTEALPPKAAETETRSQAENRSAAAPSTVKASVEVTR